MLTSWMRTGKHLAFPPLVPGYSHSQKNRKGSFLHFTNEKTEATTSSKLNKD